MSCSLNITRSFILFVVVLLPTGCASEKPKPGYSHLWVGDYDINVWSYERIETYCENGGEEEPVGDYLVRALSKGDYATFPSGAVVKYDGTDLSIGDEVIDRKHVQVEVNGKIRKNAYIQVD